MTEVLNLFGSHVLKMEYFTSRFGRLPWATDEVLTSTHLNTQPWITGHGPNSLPKAPVEDV